MTQIPLADEVKVSKQAESHQKRKYSWFPDKTTNKSKISALAFSKHSILLLLLSARNFPFSHCLLYIRNKWLNKNESHYRRHPSQEKIPLKYATASTHKSIQGHFRRFPANPLTGDQKLTNWCDWSSARFSWILLVNFSDQLRREMKKKDRERENINRPESWRRAKGRDHGGRGSWERLRRRSVRPDGE